MAILAVSLAIIFSKAAASQRVHAEGAHKVLRVPFLVESSNTFASDRFSATSTKGARLLVVMGLTVWLPTVLKERSSSKVLLAVLAHKVLWMPLLSQRIDTFAFDGLVAGPTARSKRSIEAALAVGPRVSLVESAVLEGAEALGADEVVQMPFLADSIHTAIQYGLVTMCTSSTEQLLIASLAVGHSILLIEIIGAQGILAIATCKVLGMERLPEGLDHLPKNWLTTLSTRSSCSGSTAVDIRNLAGEIAD